jgi:hypothetical protein
MHLLNSRRFYEDEQDPRVLLLYDSFACLMANSKRRCFSRNFDISSLTFKRYISELRCYFANFDPYNEVIYDRYHDAYYLVKASENLALIFKVKVSN